MKNVFYCVLQLKTVINYKICIILLFDQCRCFLPVNLKRHTTKHTLLDLPLVKLIYL